MSSTRALSLSVWLLLVALASWIVARAHYIADLSAFLPRSPSPTQQLLVQQLQEGPASRLILIGIESADASARAAASKALAAALRTRPAFVSVSNGEASSETKDREFVFEHRYLLSSAVTADRFSAEGLKSAIAESLDLITSPAGLLAKSLFRADPPARHCRSSINWAVPGSSRPTRACGAPLMVSARCCWRRPAPAARTPTRRRRH